MYDYAYFIFKTFFISTSTHMTISKLSKRIQRLEPILISISQNVSITPVTEITDLR